MSPRTAPARPGYLSQIANPVPPGATPLKPRITPPRPGEVPAPPTVHDTSELRTAPAKPRHLPAIFAHRIAPAVALEPNPPATPTKGHATAAAASSIEDTPPSGTPTRRSSPSPQHDVPAQKQSASPSTIISRTAPRTGEAFPHAQPQPSVGPAATPPLVLSTVQPALSTPPTPPRPTPTVHIGTLEIRTRLPQPAVPAAAQRAAALQVKRSETRAASPQHPASPLARSLAWSFGLVQG